MKKLVVYELIEEDVQYVAEESLGRRLTSKEIKGLKNRIAEKINWFDAIESTINEKIAKSPEISLT